MGADYGEGAGLGACGEEAEWWAVEVHLPAFGKALVRSVWRASSAFCHIDSIHHHSEII